MWTRKKYSQESQSNEKAEFLRTLRIPPTIVCVSGKVFIVPCSDHHTWAQLSGIMYLVRSPRTDTYHFPLLWDKRPSKGILAEGFNFVFCSETTKLKNFDLVHCFGNWCPAKKVLQMKSVWGWVGFWRTISPGISKSSRMARDSLMAEHNLITLTGVAELILGKSYLPATEPESMAARLAKWRTWFTS